MYFVNEYIILYFHFASKMGIIYAITKIIKIVLNFKIHIRPDNFNG